MANAYRLTTTDARQPTTQPKPRPVPVVKAPGMPEPPDDACNEHLQSRLIADGSGTLLVGTACSCVAEELTVKGKRVRSILRRGE